jgi:hypothetical protein
MRHMPFPLALVPGVCLAVSMSALPAQAFGSSDSIEIKQDTGSYFSRKYRVALTPPFPYDRRAQTTLRVRGEGQKVTVNDRFRTRLAPGQYTVSMTGRPEQLPASLRFRDIVHSNYELRNGWKCDLGVSSASPIGAHERYWAGSLPQAINPGYPLATTYEAVSRFAPVMYFNSQYAIPYRMRSGYAGVGYYHVTDDRVIAVDPDSVQDGLPPTEGVEGYSYNSDWDFPPWDAPNGSWPFAGWAAVSVDEARPTGERILVDEFTPYTIVYEGPVTCRQDQTNAQYTTTYRSEGSAPDSVTDLGDKDTLVADLQQVSPSSLPIVRLRQRFQVRPINYPYATRREAFAIKIGMTKQQVARIVGSRGVEFARYSGGESRDYDADFRIDPVHILYLRGRVETIDRAVPNY